VTILVFACGMVVGGALLYAGLCLMAVREHTRANVSPNNMLVNCDLGETRKKGRRM
jgi:hypothetical protein